MMLFKKTRIILLTLLFFIIPLGVVFASGGEHAVDSGVLLKDFLYRVLNFAIVVGILWYFLAKPLKNGLSKRTKDIEKNLAEAKQAKEEAEEKFAEYDRKLTQATEEIAEISDAIRREGELEKQKIIENAKITAAQIEKDAEAAVNLEIAKAKEQLQREAVQLSVDLAEELLKKNFNKEDDARLIDEYVKKVGELH